jgi:hypothetical protein
MAWGALIESAPGQLCLEASGTSAYVKKRSKEETQSMSLYEMECPYLRHSHPTHLGGTRRIPVREQPGITERAGREAD